MILPGEQQWLRVEQLGLELAGLSPDKAASRIAGLAAAGESTIVLSLLGTWLDLPAPPALVNSGSIVGGRYTLLNKLGEGGMGSVWRAKQQTVNRVVALKIIHPAMATPALHARFMGEIELLGRLEHEGIIRIYDAGTTEQSQGPSIPFFAMELVEGLPADRWAAEHLADRSAVLRMVAAICTAVQSAHEQHIIHRDLKPSNILVRPNGTPVIVDFGIARLTSIALGDESGVFSGTPQYAAPEQHLGRDQDFRSGESVDVYAIGAILFELLSGRRLFQFPRGASLAQIRSIVLESPVPRLSDALPGCPPFLDELVTRAVRQNPADRYYSVASLERAVGRAAELLSPAPVLVEPWKPDAGMIVPGTQWRLTSKLGEGGAGEIWAGTHDKSGVHRVFKFCDTEEKARTLRRELTLFRLLKDRVGRNLHFVQLHEVSLDEPPWYLMMDAADARDLTVWWPGDGVEKGREEVAIEIIAQTAEALQAAHEAGILHRDIKPANLLIQTTTHPPGIHVFIADFGVGQIAAQELLLAGTPAGFTRTVLDLQTNRLSGTLLYLAPEVIEGNPATARSDVYSLGVVLWQLLVGNVRAALDPAGWHQRISDPLLREDLARCLAGSPEKRWLSAGELAASLRSLPERREVAARRQAEIAMRERAAYRRGVYRTAGVAIALIALFAELVWFARNKSKESEVRREELAVAQTRTALDELKAFADLKSSEARNQLTTQAPKLEIQGADLESEFRETAARILALPVFDSLGSVPFALGSKDRFSGDGERLVKADPGGARFIDLSADPPMVHQLPVQAPPVSSLGLSLAGFTAGAICADGNLHIWDGNNFSKQSIVSGPFYSGTFAFSPSPLAQAQKTAVAVARLDGSVEVSLVGETNPPLRLLRRSTDTSDEFPESCPASMLAFSLSQDGVIAAAGSQSDILLFWKIRDQKHAKLAGGELAGAAWHPDTITCLSWSPVGDEIATGCQDGLLRIWRFNVTSNAPQTQAVRWADLGGRLRDLAWSFDGSSIAVLLDSGEVRVLNAIYPDEHPIASVNCAGANHVAFGSGDCLMAWGTNGTRAWGSGEAPYFSERRISQGLTYVNFHPEGCLIATSPDLIGFLNPSTLALTIGFQTVFQHAAFMNGTNLIYDSNDQWYRARLGRVEGEPPSLRFFGAPHKLAGTNFVNSSKGERMAWLDTNGLHCGLSHEKEEGLPARLRTEPNVIAVSDAGAITAWSSEDGVLHVHNHSNAIDQSVQLSTPLLGLAFSPEPDLLACRSEDGVIFVNPLTLKQAGCALPVGGNLAGPIAFSSDGRWVVATRQDNSLVIAAVPLTPDRWEHEGSALKSTFSHPMVLRAPASRRIVSLHWNPNGSRLACGTADGFAQSWDVSLLRQRLRLWYMDWSSDSPPKEAAFLPVRVGD